MTYPLTRSTTDAQKERWKTHPEINLVGGIDTTERPESLKEGQVIQAENVFAYKRDLRLDTGYTHLGIGMANLDSKARRVINFLDLVDGFEEVVAITDGSVYVYNTTIKEWQYVKGDAGTALDGDHATSSTSLVVASSTGFTAGDPIGIFLTDGSQYRTEVDTVPGGGVTITIPAPGLPSDASDGGLIYKAVALNGSQNYPVMAAIVPSNNWLVFTNNVDNVKRYDGEDCVDVEGLTATTCRAVVLYNSALFLLGTTESGIYHGTRIRRSEIGDPTTWDTGTAGYDDLLDTDGDIIGGDVLGPYLIVYKRRTIYRGSFLNTGTKYYQFDAMLHGETGEGLAATSGIVNLGAYHIFIGNSNIYKYYGDFSITPIGDSIFFLMFSADAPVNTTRFELSWGIYIEQLREVWLGYCSASATWPDRLLRYNVDSGAWMTRTFSHPMTTAGLFNALSSFAWEDLIGLWSEQTWEWSSRIAAGVSRPIVLLCPSTVECVFVYDFVTTTDLEDTITGQVTTRDFVWAGGKFRTDRLDMFIQGLNILIEYSEDQGITWNEWETISQSVMDKVKSYRQIVCDTARFRFTCSDPNFKIRWISLTWSPESV